MGLLYLQETKADTPVPRVGHVAVTVPRAPCFIGVAEPRTSCEVSEVIFAAQRVPSAGHGSRMSRLVWGEGRGIYCLSPEVQKPPYDVTLNSENGQNE